MSIIRQKRYRAEGGGVKGRARIEYIGVEEVMYAERNPKDHDIGAIVESIRRFGFVDPGILDERTGRLIAGAGRKEALMVMKRGGEGMPNGLEEGWKWPIVRGMSTEDDDEALAYLIADNRLVEIGGWDEWALGEALEELKKKGEELLAGVGYDGDDIDEIWERLKGKGREDGGMNAAEEEERLGEIEAEYEVGEGEVWRVGKNFVGCGDCRAWSVWERLFECAGVMEVDGIMTSPPYAEQRKGDYPSAPPEEYGNWFEPAARWMKKALAKDGSLFLNLKANVEGGERLLYAMDLVKMMKVELGWAFIDEYCWLRNPPPGSWPNRFKNGFEPVYHFGLQPLVKFRPENVKGSEAGEWDKPNGNVNTGSYYHTSNSSFSWDGSLPSNVIDVKANAAASGHSAAFPTGLPSFFIQAFSDETDVWVDPFLGSGSTVIAAARNGRVGLGIEVVPQFAAIAVTRIARALETTAEKVK